MNKVIYMYIIYYIYANSFPFSRWHSQYKAPGLVFLFFIKKGHTE